MPQRRTLLKVGNSFAITLPSDYLVELGMRRGDKILVELRKSPNKPGLFLSSLAPEIDVDSKPPFLTT